MRIAGRIEARGVSVNTFLYVSRLCVVSFNSLLLLLLTENARLRDVCACFSLLLL